MIWNKKNIEHETVRSISSRYSLDLLTASIFARRGISEPQALSFFMEDDISYLHNPFMFYEMSEVVERILSAAQEGEKILIFGDRDVDGISSTVLLKDALDDLGIDNYWRLPAGDDAYGLTIESVDEAASKDVTLILTVDCGISNYAEITHAKEKGIDTIIVDHHNPPEVLPSALYILDPKMEDSGYPFKNLAGCGVVAKLVWALRFGKTDLFNQTLCLLNIKPGNDTYVIEAVKICNFEEVDRLRESIVPGYVDVNSTRLNDFLTGHELLVYDAEPQVKMLKKLFGNDVDIALTDIAESLWDFFPKIKNNSLLKILSYSKKSKYSNRTLEEIDVLINLFQSFALKKYPELSSEYEKVLDLVALGTVADLMPLVNENRIIVKKGLKQLNNTERKGLRGLIFRQNLELKTIKAIDIAWQLSPVINSTGRMGVPEKAAELLFETDTKKIELMLDEILSLNKKRKKIGDAVWNKILPQAEKTFEQSNKKLVVVSGKHIHRGITGIIAARLSSYFKVPSMVIAFLDAKVVGSMRSFRGVNVKDFLLNFENYFTDFGGHDFAAGFNLPHENYDKFFDSVIKSSDKISFEVKEETINLDAELPMKFLNPDLIKIVEKFEPYGEGNKPLVFLAKGLKILEIDIIGKNDPQHVKLLLDTGKYKWPALYWNSAERIGKEFTKSDTVDVLFRLGRNYFQNKESLQLTIMDLKRGD